MIDNYCDAYQIEPLPVGYFFLSVPAPLTDNIVKVRLLDESCLHIALNWPGDTIGRNKYLLHWPK